MGETMPLEFGLWRVTDGAPVRLASTGVPLEKQLEDFIHADPSMLGERLMLIGRQVPTGYGFIDLLAVDSEGGLHILELKRDMTPREVVAQVIDYGAWVKELDYQRVVAVYEAFQPGVPFEQAFVDFFGGDPPEELNAAHYMTIVAGRIDAATERIVTYLAEEWGLTINVVMFQYFTDGGHSYLARTFLIDQDAAGPSSAKAKAQPGPKEPWNGRDWYVSFGLDSGVRDWDDARRYGFVSAGGGKWYSKTLQSLQPSAHINVNIPGTGYVGVGKVTGTAVRFDQAVLSVEGEPRAMRELALLGTYRHAPEGAAEGDETAEWIVPVEWEHTVPVDQAVWRKGMFANQNSACKLRQSFTLQELAKAFGTENEE